MRYLTDVSDASDVEEALAKADKEPSSQKHGHGCGRRLDAGTQDDHGGTGKHAPSSPEEVVYGAAHGQSGDCANVVHGKDQSSGRTCGFPGNMVNKGALACKSTDTKDVERQIRKYSTLTVRSIRDIAAMH